MQKIERKILYFTFTENCIKYELEAILSSNRTTISFIDSYLGKVIFNIRNEKLIYVSSPLSISMYISLFRILKTVKRNFY
jgi:hypothetical protein